jgi:hypothetical protein
MMEQTIESFFHDFRQELLAGAEAKGNFLLDEFIETVSTELVETGFVEDFELCHYRPSQGGMRVDGYWFNDEGVLDLLVADFDSRSELKSLTRTDVQATFKRAINFVEASVNKRLYEDLEVTSPPYGLSRQISDRWDAIRKLNLVLLSERSLSDRLNEIPDIEVAGVPTSHQIWDISRLHRQRTSRSHKEPLDFDFEKMFGNGIACLPAHIDTDTYQSYLLVMPASILASLYEKFGARLLEQNVRTFLQARGNVNKGIRETILNEPGMFFAYNNGITATAQEVETQMTTNGLEIKRIVDFQVVNGGQTTASLFHTRKRDKADLSQIFVQMKLSVISGQQSEAVVPKISEYANTQNRVNAADFFSNHPFHVRMEGFSRRLWAPAQQGMQRETKWFYERARGQYADEQLKLTLADQRRFKTEYPKSQMFTKTDLAKFENVWDDHPRWVNLGSQKNFARYAVRIGNAWDKSSDEFHEFYFKRVVARGILFRATEGIVSAQAWYSGGYRANIVAYTLAVLGEIAKRRKESINFLEIWRTQNIDPALGSAILIIAAAVNEEISAPNHGVSNISEWCKREACWTQLMTKIDHIETLLSEEFYDRLISLNEQAQEGRSAKKNQQIDKGIEAQRQVLAVPSETWKNILQILLEKDILAPKEIGVLKIAIHIPVKIPTEKQCAVLLDVLAKARSEGVRIV